MCMGAAWREAPQGREFENVLEMVRGVSALGMEVCCTLGMLTDDTGGAAEGSGTDGIQPQSGYVAGILWLDYHHARVRGAVEDIGVGAQSGDHGVLRGNSGDGRKGERPQ